MFCWSDQRFSKWSIEWHVLLLRSSHLCCDERWFCRPMLSVSDAWKLQLLNTTLAQKRVVIWSITHHKAIFLFSCIRWPMTPEEKRVNTSLEWICCNESPSSDISESKCHSAGCWYYSLAITGHVPPIVFQVVLDVCLGTVPRRRVPSHSVIC